MARDPVCGKDVDEARLQRPQSSIASGATEIDPAVGTKSFHDGQWYYFCSLACRALFMGNPEQYTGDIAQT